MESLGWSPSGERAGGAAAPYPAAPGAAIGHAPPGGGNLRGILAILAAGLLVAVAAGMTVLYAGARGRAASERANLRAATAQASAARATAATDRKVGAVLQAYATTAGAAQKTLMAETQANGNADARVALQDELNSLAGPRAVILGARLPGALQPALADVQQAFADLLTAVQIQISGIDNSSDAQIGTGILDEQSAAQRLSSTVATLQGHLGA